MLKLLTIIILPLTITCIAQLPPGRYLKVKDDGSGFELFTLNAVTSTKLADSVATLRGVILTGLSTKQNTLGFTPYNATNPSGYISAVPAQTFNSLTGKPTTILGYGITDAQPLGNYASGIANTGDNATNTQYSGLAAQKLNTNGDGSALAGLTKGQVGLSNVDNTADLAKPLSTAATNANALKANVANPSLTGTVTTTGSFGITAGAGSGGSVTQLTNRSTAVTLNKISGTVITINTSLAAGAEATFTVNNSTVVIGDVILLSARAGQTAATSIPFVTAVANGSFNITLSNFNATTADTGAMTINFIVLKSVNN